MDNDELLCPSARAKPGTVLVGIAAGPGALGYVTPPVRVDDEFLAAAGDTPERRFRFAGPCVKGDCHNWGEDRCQLIHQILRTRPVDATTELVPCPIRATCRWFAQTGREACAACPEVRNPALPLPDRTATRSTS